MHRKLHERYPFLMFVEPEEESGGGRTGGEPTGKTPDGTDREEAFAHRLAKEREKWEKEHAEAFAKAKQHDELLESQKTEAQKAIDAAAKERDDALAEVAKSRREIALTKAGIAEDEWDDFADWTPAQIAKYGEKAAAAVADDTKRPRQRGIAQFVSGGGTNDEPEETNPRKLAALIRGEK